MDGQDRQDEKHQSVKARCDVREREDGGLENAVALATSVVLSELMSRGDPYRQLRMRIDRLKPAIRHRAFGTGWNDCLSSP